MNSDTVYHELRSGPGRQVIREAKRAKGPKVPFLTSDISSLKTMTLPGSKSHGPLISGDPPGLHTARAGLMSLVYAHGGFDLGRLLRPPYGVLAMTLVLLKIYSPSGR